MKTTQELTNEVLAELQAENEHEAKKQIRGLLLEIKGQHDIIKTAEKKIITLQTTLKNVKVDITEIVIG